MGQLDFFKRNSKLKNEKVKLEKPSPSQILFTETVLEIISPAIETFGFDRQFTGITKHSSTIIFRKDRQYVKINSSNYPTDYPYFFNIILGEGDSEDFFECDWNSIALWRLKDKIDPTVKSKEYQFPIGDKVKQSVENAKNELIIYGVSFLNGDLTLFLETRTEQNKNREPYKIHTPDENGNYKTTDEPTSIEQKKKYSRRT